MLAAYRSSILGRFSRLPLPPRSPPFHTGLRGSGAVALCSGHGWREWARRRVMNKTVAAAVLGISFLACGVTWKSDLFHANGQVAVVRGEHDPEGNRLGPWVGRGRDSGSPEPPAQIPASGTTALGSYLG